MLIKLKVDQLINSGLSNFKIINFLDSTIKVPSDLIPTNVQLTDRRHYLGRIILQELKKNTKGGFYSWLEANNLKIERATDHDFLILAHLLDNNNFVLIFSTRSLLQNGIKQAEITGQSYLAMDATHKLVSCGMMFTTFATSTLNQEIADIGYMLH